MDDFADNIDGRLGIEAITRPLARIPIRMFVCHETVNGTLVG